MPNIGNIEIKGVKKNKPKLKGGYYVLPFYQTKNSLQNLESLNKFIKSTENLIRKNTRYNRYVAYLKVERGLDFCQVHPNIVDDGKLVKIEMHHGPILTLYDYCNIVVNALLNRGETITTFRVASIVLDEHFKHHVQTVMLCENCHDVFHAGSYLYINPKQAHGDIRGFIEEWSDGIDDDMRRIINENLKLCKKFHSCDNGVLDTRSGKSWN